MLLLSLPQGRGVRHVGQERGYTEVSSPHMSCCKQIGFCFGSLLSAEEFPVSSTPFQFQIYRCKGTEGSFFLTVISLIPDASPERLSPSVQHRGYQRLCVQYGTGELRRGEAAFRTGCRTLTPGLQRSPQLVPCRQKDGDSVVE